ncbi:exodeoxyribonuclease VII small subunit [Youxingia wuxianensis]|uniref:Exodeoxyribonuclease 7 small subunit n=1 Tax=Youxingia wuxianensis TaxID=2763678 RepID=A0A926IGF9_9FIRM|nr:exodeoxyribonuclease VII small subunit [Youxingia wuxianensis]MBC8584206.1 exodeoxyribonuclease VII small subunit [Youxingia wuxianensis]
MKQQTLETAIQRLEEITAQMNDSELTVDQSITLYTEAVKLIEFSEKKLADAKLKVEKLSVGVQNEE